MSEFEKVGEVVLSRTGRTWVDARLGILRFEANAGADQTLDDARENMEAVAKLSNGKRYPMLVDLTRSKALGQEAREYYGKPESRSKYRALALLGQSPVSKMLGNLWFAIYGDRDVPTKLFTSEAEAIAWLRGFVR